jgi:hypothetical protein
MERTPRTILISLVGITFFIFIVFFAYNRFGRYINGPEISNINLETYQTIERTSYLVQGTVINTANMRINNREIILNQDQSFEKMIVLSPGHTIIEIEVMDSFDKVREYSYTLSSTQTEEIYPTTYKQAQEEENVLQDDEGLEIIN